MIATTYDAAPVRELALPRGTVRYRELGSGEPIVLVHGLLVNGLLWRDVADVLALDFRVIVPDWPFGSHDVPLPREADRTPAGMAALIGDFIAGLELEDVTLVGNDTGGGLCQIVAVDHGERLGRLVLTPCDAYDSFPPPMFKPLTWAGHVPGAVWAIAQGMRLDAVRRAPFAFGG